MKPFRLQISAAAFTTPEGWVFAHRVARLLRQAADKIEDSAQFAHNLIDREGQKVGKCGIDVDLTPRKEDDRGD